jgi:hypothetical protein
MTEEMAIAAIRNIIGSSLTNHPIDNARAVLLLRAASVSGFHDMAKQEIKRARYRWLIYLTITQRKWQNNRRTITPRSCQIRWRRWGKRHDMGTIMRAEKESVATREKYVRCA